MMRKQWGRMALLLVCFCVACSAMKSKSGAKAALKRTVYPKNIILVIADGWGPAAVSLLLNYKRLVEKQNSIFETISHESSSGFVLTSPSEGIVTDSAAAATAYATGSKTLNGMLSISPDGRILDTVLERAQAFGKRTGLITNDTITGATTAAFAAHIGDRSREPELAAKLLEKRVSVLLGGGMEYFIPKGTQAGQNLTFMRPGQFGESKRMDNRDLTLEAAQAGYVVCNNREQLWAATGGAKPVLGLFSAGQLPYRIDRQLPDQIPSLTEMFRAAITILESGPNGYFLVAESERIDSALHQNDPGALLYEMLETEDLLKAVWEHAVAHPDTLVVITADHDTAGMAFVSNPTENGPTRLLSNEHYEAKLVMPDLAILEKIRSQRASFRSIVDEAAGRADELKKILAAKTAYDAISLSQLAEVFQPAEGGPKKASYSQGQSKPVHRLSELISSRLLLFWASGYHTHSPVFLFAQGPLSERMRGIRSNDEIGRALLNAMQPVDAVIE